MRTRSYPINWARKLGTAVLCSLFVATSLTFAQTWTQSSAPSLDWLSLACSADGSHLLAGGNSALCTSTNGGADWTTNNVPVHTWRCVACSADGSQLAAAVGYPDTGRIYLSTNYGGLWTTSSAPVKQWVLLEMSADGTKLMALPGGGPLYTSSDSGMTWATNALPTTALTGIASSLNGNQWVALKGGGSVFVSTDFGASWASNNIHGGLLDMPCLGASADGSTLVAAQGGNGGFIYTSTNAGSSWTTNTLRDVWLSAAASADGHRLIAAGYDWIYTSTNSGVTWISNNAPRLSWGAVASSADGNTLIAAAFPGGIYTWHTTPSPSLNINLAPAHSNLALSWRIPSTSFVLQQSSDLANWSDATNAPLLDLTNLQNQVVIPLSGSNGFYRLVTP